MLVTALAPHIGYDNAAKIAKVALKNGTTLKHETLKTGLVDEKDYEKIVDPKKMIYPSWRPISLFNNLLLLVKLLKLKLSAILWNWSLTLLSSILIFLNAISLPKKS